MHSTANIWQSICYFYCGNKQIQEPLPISYITSIFYTDFPINIRNCSVIEQFGKSNISLQCFGLLCKYIFIINLGAVLHIPQKQHFLHFQNIDGTYRNFPRCNKILLVLFLHHITFFNVTTQNCSIEKNKSKTISYNSAHSYDIQHNIT